MKLGKGDAVEVLRRGKDQSDSWFPGTIILAEGYVYTIRYLFLDRDGASVVEEVTAENVRPKPPPLEGERWAPGDMIEFFDLHCWRAGKVAKVLNQNRLVIKPVGSIQLKEFQRSNLRIRQDWRNNKWVVFEKVLENKEMKNAGSASKSSKGSGCVAPELVINKEAGIKENGRPKQFETFPPAKTLKRKHEYNLGLSPVDAATAGVGDKKTAGAERHGTLPRGTSPVLKQDIQQHWELEDLLEHST